MQEYQQVPNELVRVYANQLKVNSRSAVVAEIPDQEIANGSFRSKLREWRCRFDERREGVAAAR